MTVKHEWPWNIKTIKHQCHYYYYYYYYYYYSIIGQSMVYQFKSIVIYQNIKHQWPILTNANSQEWWPVDDDLSIIDSSLLTIIPDGQWQSLQPFLAISH